MTTPITRFQNIFGSYQLDERNAALQFSYVNSSFTEYKEIESDRPFMKRITLFEGLKGAACCLANAISLIAKGIYLSFSRLQVSELSNKLLLFGAVRSVEIALGFLVLPFHQAAGSYLLEKALYHIMIYKQLAALILKACNEAEVAA